jgi:hypothetical protein
VYEHVPASALQTHFAAVAISIAEAAVDARGSEHTLVDLQVAHQVVKVVMAIGVGRAATLDSGPFTDRVDAHVIRTRVAVVEAVRVVETRREALIVFLVAGLTRGARARAVHAIAAVDVAGLVGGAEQAVVAIRILRTEKAKGGII